MKNFKFLLLNLCLLFIISAFSQNSKQSVTKSNFIKNTQGVFTFKSETIDYGTINQNSDGKREFVFKNTGAKPIIITKVKGSCGCTVATKPEKPIMPGETSSIKVVYATNRIGKFNKSITIISNAIEANKVLRIKGNVIKSEKVLTPKKSIVSAN